MFRGELSMQYVLAAPSKETSDSRNHKRHLLISTHVI